MKFNSMRLEQTGEHHWRLELVKAGLLDYLSLLVLLGLAINSKLRFLEEGE
jgi:hypothetical protein